MVEWREQKPLQTLVRYTPPPFFISFFSVFWCTGGFRFTGKFLIPSSLYFTARIFLFCCRYSPKKTPFYRITKSHSVFLFPAESTRTEFSRPFRWGTSFLHCDIITVWPANHEFWPVTQHPLIWSLYKLHFISKCWVKVHFILKVFFYKIIFIIIIF